MKRITWNILVLTATICLAFLISACGEKAQNNRNAQLGTMTIKSSPEDATITILGKEIGVTPKTTNPVPPQMYIVKIAKDGYISRWTPVKVEAGKDTLLEVKLQPVTALAMLTSEPEGAKVIKNNQEVGITPCVLTNLAFGPHSVLLKLDGYSTQEINWNITSGRPFAEHTVLRTDTGTIKIDSEPDDASVSIDKIPHGRTPSVEKVSHGQRTVRVEKDGYEPFTTVVTVKRDETTEIHAKLRFMPIPITIKTTPSQAKVYVNGKFCGDSPCTFRAEQPGKYHIRAEKNNFTGAEQKIAVSAGNKYDISLALTSELGAMEIRTKPSGAEIFIDGKFSGKTQADASQQHGILSKVFHADNLAQGKHTLKVIHPRAVKADQEKIIRFEVKKGKVTTLKTVEMWVPNARLRLKKGFITEGRILDFDSDPIVFEPKPGVKVDYPKKEVREIIRIKDED